ncbi:oxidoreductase [Pigmentiphaga litoralis]|uniref:PDR/VanB family oxidoreductase n=1 Tax=Pigmentiphaga litoralis TaxID=516702 RepID=UPI001674B523|nr:PDR/VanB family oxidoreductase [Pigmentiphaga litoralis]GGX21503.1 oxidoreductase [Pigmentiphaga litoralis]
MRPRLFDVHVAALRPLTPQVNEYLLRAADGGPLPAYEAGAHIELHWTMPDGEPMLRHYSLIGGDATRDDPPGVWRIAVQREDRARGSADLHRRYIAGMALTCSHPIHHFRMDRRDTHSVLIAGGIGITPILSMLRSVVRRGCSFDMIYTARTAERMAYRHEVATLAGARGRLHETSTHGRLDVAGYLSTQPAGATAYVCGPATLTQAVKDAAAALGWDPARVRSEVFAAAPSVDDVAFAVELRASGRTLRVPAGATILDTLTAAGLHPLYDCRRGECGLCPMPVVAADGPLRHRDSYLSADERAAGKSLCICVSRMQGELLVLDA